MECGICTEICDTLVSEFMCDHKMCSVCDLQLQKRFMKCPWCRPNRKNALPLSARVVVRLSDNGIVVVPSGVDDSFPLQRMLDDHRNIINQIVEVVILRHLENIEETEEHTHNV